MSITLKPAITKFVQQNERMNNPLVSEFSFLTNLDEGRMIIVGGASGLGKTAFCLQMSYNLAKLNKDRADSILVKYFSSEMMIEELAMRLIVNQQVLEGVTMDNVRQFFNPAKLPTEVLESNIRIAEKALDIENFEMVDSSRFTIEKIIEDIKTTRIENPIKKIFFVVDYLQLLCPASEMDSALRELKNAIVENGVNIVVISSLNRESAKQQLKELSAFKGNGAIEYGADMAILLTADKDVDLNNDNPIEIEVNLLKNRIGRKAEILYSYDKSIQQYTQK